MLTVAAPASLGAIPTDFVPSARPPSAWSVVRNGCHNSGVGIANQEDEIMSGAEWYAEYLKSPHWRHLRRRKIEVSGAKCHRCGEAGVEFEGRWFNLHVHHLTYDRCPDEELLNDLEVLCICCHEAEHGRIEEASDEVRDFYRRLAHQQVMQSFMFWSASVDEIDSEIKQWDELAEAAGL